MPFTLVKPTPMDWTGKRIVAGDQVPFITKFEATQDMLAAFVDECRQMVDSIQAGYDGMVAQMNATQAAAAASATAADQSQALARSWATAPQGSEVQPGQYSACHWAQVAEQKVTGDTPITSLAPGDLAVPGDYVSVDGAGKAAVRNVPQEIADWASAGTNPAALQRYDLAVNDTYAAYDTTDVDIDLSAGPQVVIVGNRSLRTVNLNNPPAGRSILVIVYATGSAGLSFPDLSSAAYWDGGEIPEAGDYWTQYLLWWGGFGYWRGGVGFKR